MRIGPFTLTRTKQAGGDLITPWPVSTGGASAGGWWPIIRESFAGAWQRGVTASVEDVATHPTFFACGTLIAGDVAKCRPMLIEEVDDVCVEVENAAYSPVIRRPNHYQNRIQFYEYWVLSKVFRGNTYALKARDNRGVVTDLYLLDPTRVRPMVTPRGDVYYALGQDVLAGVNEQTTLVPAREIIHDRWNCLYHPLVGLSPVYASGHAAIQALTIMSNATRLFRNGSQVGGVLTAPGAISNDTAKRLEEYWQANYSGEANIGKVVALGDGLKFEKPTVMSAVDAQLIDILKWDDEKVCATLHVPPYMVSVGPLPSYNNVEALGQQYYGQCLQRLFEDLELCLTEGLEVKGFEIEFEIETLDRMDSVQRMEVATKGASGGVLSPNEARLRFSRRLGPVTGGNKVFMQKQNWPLDLLGSDNVPPPAPAAPKASDPPSAPATKAMPDGDVDQTDALVAAIEEAA
jgi:HK97 family phage portal protein